uniref:Uncharacterized protein n=1 Tax=Vespula pensylvanica TaxID=30213 RepID=A0A834JYP7_VESPE|nr:hypothetical protein H0235_016671 [Vespula pensylvanica]
MSDTQIKEWFKRFESGSTSVESNPSSVIEEDLGIPKTVISEIISQDLNMSHVAKFGPRLLIDKLKNYRMETWNNLEQQKLSLCCGKCPKSNDKIKRFRVETTKKKLLIANTLQNVRW